MRFGHARGAGLKGPSIHPPIVGLCQGDPVETGRANWAERRSLSAGDPAIYKRLMMQDRKKSRSFRCALADSTIAAFFRPNGKLGIFRFHGQLKLILQQPLAMK
jgi:hypothetical protein